MALSSLGACPAKGIAQGSGRIKIPAPRLTRHLQTLRLSVAVG